MNLGRLGFGLVRILFTWVDLFGIAVFAPPNKSTQPTQNPKQTINSHHAPQNQPQPRCLQPPI